jgi:hypothetical protein
MIAGAAMRSSDDSASERGVALILALMALLLLTAIGLMLATTASIETQSATNYRWSRKAFYNAEAGIAVGRVALADMAWSYVLPPARGPWEASTPTPPVPAPESSGTSRSGGAARDFEMAVCDLAGNGMGYGAVLWDEDTTYENVSQVAGTRLDGSFTLWVRRPHIYPAAGWVADYPGDDALILVSEGVAPASAPGLPGAQATEVIEVTLFASAAGITLGPPAFSLAGLTVGATTTPFKVGSSVCR